MQLSGQPLSLLAPATNQEANLTEIHHTTRESNAIRKLLGRIEVYRITDKIAVA